MLATGGKPVRLMLMSEPATASACVTLLLPPAVVPPFVSFTAPVTVVTLTLPEVVGVPLIAQDMLLPAATVAGGAGVQLVTVTPAGKPEIEHVAEVAAAVAVPLLVHFTVPEYGVPTTAVVGSPLRSGAMSEPVTASVDVAELLAELPSLLAPVVPVRVFEPTAVGVPETVHVIVAAAARVVGGVGEQLVVRPAGRPATLQVAAVAEAVADAAFVHVKVPEYATPMLAVVGRVERSMLTSEPTVATGLLAELLPPAVVPPLPSLIAPVTAVTVLLPAAVGVPLTGHVMLAPAARVVGGTGAHVPRVTPGGNPEIAQVADVADAVAVALFVHLIVPL